MVIRALANVINFYSVKFLAACRSVKEANQTESIFSLVVAQAHCRVTFCSYKKLAISETKTLCHH